MATIIHYHKRMKEPRYGALSSSQDPEQIATTVKGIVLALSSVIILVAGSVFHITLSAGDVLSLATDIGIGAGAVWTIYGLIMKLVVWFADRKA